MTTEDSNEPLQTVGDEALEARIVAWVLGEASAFEAAEMEELCGKDPEVALFVRRMRMLDGVLREKADESWKLPDEKRAKLLEVIGEEERGSSHGVRKGKRGWSHAVRRGLMPIAAVLVLVAVLGFLSLPMILRQRKSAEQMAPTFGHYAAPSAPVPEGVHYKYVEEGPARSMGSDALPPLSNEAPPVPQKEPRLRVPQPATPDPVADGESSSDLYRFGMPNGRTLREKSSGDRQGDLRWFYDAELGEAEPGGSAVTSSGVVDESLSRSAGEVGDLSAMDQKENAPAAPAAGPAVVLKPVPKSSSAMDFGFDESTVTGNLSGGVETRYDGRRSGRRGGAKDVEGTEVLDGLGDVPMLGRLFGVESEERKKKEEAVPELQLQMDPFSGDVDHGAAVVDSDTDGDDDAFAAPDMSGAGLEDPFADNEKVAESDFWGGAVADEAPRIGSEAEFGDNFDHSAGIVPETAEPTRRQLAQEVEELWDLQNRGEISSRLGLELLDAEKELQRDGAVGGRTAGSGREASQDELATGQQMGFGGGGAGAAGGETVGSDRVTDLASSLSSGDADEPALPVTPADGSGGVDDDPVRSNPALTADHVQNVNEVRWNLVEAEGHFNLGRFEEAKSSYAETLRIDPYNAAARRGLEQIELAKSSYYRAAYDVTRAELLAEVDSAWETTVPPAYTDEALALARRIQGQEELVEEKRKALTQLIRNEGVIYSRGTDGEGGFSEERQALNAAQAYAELETEKIRLESQIDTLLRQEADQLITYAAGLNLPENIIRTLHPRWLEAKRSLEQTQLEGLGEDHPRVRQQTAIVDGLNRDMEEEVVALRETLRAQLDLVAEQLEQLKIKKDQEGAEALPVGVARYSFDDAREEYEQVVVELERLRLELAESVAQGASVSSDPEAEHADMQSLTETLDLMAEVQASEEPFSTFSLHVSDASFKLASAALQRGERPEAESIRPEEFYNAFDYGDPAPSAGEPVACVVEQAAHPVFPQRNVLRIGVRAGASGRAQTVPLNVTLLLDNSGSMERDDRAEGVTRAVEQLASLLQPGDKVTVAGFSRTPRLLADQLDGGQAAELNGIVRQVPAEGGTNLEQAMILGEELAMRQYQEGAQNRMVLFTDGAANLGDADPESLNTRVETMRQNGIAFDAAGFGADGLNDRLLERLTRNGNGRYYVVDDPSEADEGFARKLAGAFRPAAENVKVQVVFNPERVGNYKLIGFEEHRLEKEDFRDDSVDAAEMASEESGVALYQMQVLPEGRGEIGEVRVRFRDAASGKMVERNWTIPYESDAPGFDRAAESIQLATLAAMAAEKLREAPMAGSIDFSDLAPVIGQVAAKYGDSESVTELRRMIEALR